MRCNKLNTNLIIEVANYIIQNRATIANASNHFQKSISSIKKYINDSDKLQAIDYNLYLQVKKVQKEIEHNGQIAGGKIGKRSATISDFEAQEIAENRIQKLTTIEELSILYNVPKSTLYDALERIPDEEVQEQLSEVSKTNSSRRR